MLTDFKREANISHLLKNESKTLVRIEITTFGVGTEDSHNLAHEKLILLMSGHKIDIIIPISSKSLQCEFRKS